MDALDSWIEDDQMDGRRDTWVKGPIVSLILHGSRKTDSQQLTPHNWLPTIDSQENWLPENWLPRQLTPNNWLPRKLTPNNWLPTTDSQQLTPNNWLPTIDSRKTDSQQLTPNNWLPTTDSQQLTTHWKMIYWIIHTTLKCSVSESSISTDDIALTKKGQGWNALGTCGKF